MKEKIAPRKKWVPKIAPYSRKIEQKPDFRKLEIFFRSAILLLVH